MKVNVKARDGSPLEAPVKLTTYKTHSIKGDEVASGDISNGSMTKNLPAGYYLVSVGEGKYKRKNKRVYLDKDRVVDLELEDIGDSFKIYGQFDN